MCLCFCPVCFQLLYTIFYPVFASWHIFFTYYTACNKRQISLTSQSQFIHSNERSDCSLSAHTDWQKACGFKHAKIMSYSTLSRELASKTQFFFVLHVGWAWGESLHFRHCTKGLNIKLRPRVLIWLNLHVTLKWQKWRRKIIRRSKHCHQLRSKNINPGQRCAVCGQAATFDQPTSKKGDRVI